MIPMPVYRLKVPAAARLVGDGVVYADRKEPLGRREGSGEGADHGHQVVQQRDKEGGDVPGALAEEVGDRVDIPWFNQLTGQGGQGLGPFRDEQALNHLLQVTPLGSMERQVETLQEEFHGWRGEQDRGQHGHLHERSGLCLFEQAFVVCFMLRLHFSCCM